MANHPNRSTVRRYAVSRTNAPAGERAYVGLFSLVEAKRLGRQYADADQSPVTIVDDLGPGRVSANVCVIRPSR